MEVMMKSGVIAVCVILLFAFQTNAVYANKLQAYKAEADQYYLQQNYKKAYRIYYKLAKQGDHYSQNQLSRMYANGEGKTVDLPEAYAWSVLAAESGEEKLMKSSGELLQLTGDTALAQNKATGLLQKYGEDALQEKAERLEKRRNSKKSSSCTGSRVGCSKG